MRRVLVALLVIASMLAVAQLAEAAAGLKYKRSKQQSIAAGGTMKQKVSCPRDTSVISGGVQTSSNDATTSVVSSYPFDSRRDRGKKPDDGWVGVARNIGTSPATMITHAVCSKRGKFTYMKDTFDASSGKLGLIIICPGIEPQVVGGGAAMPVVDDVELGGSAPVDDPTLGTDADSLRDDGWIALSNNDSGVVQRVTAFAICAKGGAYSYTTSSGSFSGGMVGGSSVGCPAGSAIAGGGVEAAGTNTSVELHSSMPANAFLDPDPDIDAWNGTIGTRAGGTTTVTTTSICKPVA